MGGRTVSSLGSATYGEYTDSPKKAGLRELYKKAGEAYRDYGARGALSIAGDLIRDNGIIVRKKELLLSRVKTD